MYVMFFVDDGSLNKNTIKMGFKSCLAFLCPSRHNIQTKKVTNWEFEIDK